MGKFHDVRVVKEFAHEVLDVDAFSCWMRGRADEDLFVIGGERFEGREHYIYCGQRFGTKVRRNEFRTFDDWLAG